MKAERRHGEAVDDRRRQHVLARVVLHVIETAVPVDDAMQRLSDSQLPVALHHVDDVIVVVRHVDDRERAEPSGVERLAARGGIERTAIQPDRAAVAARVDAYDHGIELAAVRVVVVEALGHAAT